MSNEKEKTKKNSLKERIKRGIEKTGFPLEMEIGRILKEKGWLKIHSYFYLDINDLTFKELDIWAFRYFNKFSVNCL